jgi:hypothetical protein
VTNFNIFDPSQWSDVHGYIVLMAVIAGTLVGTTVKLVGHRWTDWLDEPRGRGSIRDNWLLDEMKERPTTTPTAIQGLNASGRSRPAAPATNGSQPQGQEQ